MSNTDHYKEQLELFKQLCSERGLRLTHQRLEIFSILARDESHPSVEDIYKQVVTKLPMISLDTVYRTISTFQEYGLVTRVNFDGSKARFDTNISEHHHLICTGCQKVVDFYWPSFDRLKMPDEIEGWQDFQHRQAEIRALCPDCRSGRKSRKQTNAA